MDSNSRYSTLHPMPMRWLLRGLGLVLGLLVLGGCAASQPEVSVAVAQDAAGASTRLEETRMWMIVDGSRFAITLADTDAARAFAALLPLTLEMADLNSNEKHADLPNALPADATRPGTIQNGDLMLYGSSTLVVFYETFRSSYSYTRLGRVDDPRDLRRVLGQGSVRVTFAEK